MVCNHSEVSAIEEVVEAEGSMDDCKAFPCQVAVVAVRDSGVWWPVKLICQCVSHGLM